VLKCNNIITIDPLLSNYIQMSVNKKMTIIPNCVDIDYFTKFEKKDKFLVKKYCLNDSLIVGYVGSTVNYEGLDTLVYATNNLIKKGVKIKLLIVGKGKTKSCIDTFNSISVLIKKLKISDNIFLVGQIDKSIVRKYYSVIDIICIPRKNYLVCNIVPPIKIFEAMSMEKTIIASDVCPILSIIKHDNNGRLFKSDDPNDLANQIKFIYDNQYKMTEYGKNARQHIIKNNQWKPYLEKLVNIYINLYPI
jgi:glycosyltransferase involved in cell wall biosynthesis